MKKPKTLYQYNIHHELEKHAITEDCMPQVVADTSEGVRWRCRTDDHDCYGWATRDEAKKDEIYNTKTHIAKLQRHLEDLERGFSK